MHAHTRELLDHIDTQRAKLHAAVDTVPPALRETRPAPDRWSVAEVLEHLALVEGRVAHLLSNALSEARETGLEPERETDSVMDSTILARLLDRSRTVQVPEIGRPKDGMTAKTALATLDRTRRHLHEVIIASDGLAVRGIVQPHPVLGPLNFHQWIVTIGGHEARHALQIREIGEVLATS